MSLSSDVRNQNIYRSASMELHIANLAHQIQTSTIPLVHKA